jgi:hypothetical protein
MLLIVLHSQRLLETKYMKKGVLPEVIRRLRKKCMNGHKLHIFTVIFMH